MQKLIPLKRMTKENKSTVLQLIASNSPSLFLAVQPWFISVSLSWDSYYCSWRVATAIVQEWHQFHSALLGVWLQIEDGEYIRAVLHQWNTVIIGVCYHVLGC